jgi:glycogen operon protein
VFRRKQFFAGRRIWGSEVKDLAWFRPDGKEMTEDNWRDPSARCLGLRLAGDAIEEVDADGHPIVDDTFLLLLNAHYEPVPFVLPAHRGGVRWQPVLDTHSGDRKAPRPARGGRTYDVAARSLAVLRLQEAP